MKGKRKREETRPEVFVPFSSRLEIATRVLEVVQRRAGPASLYHDEGHRAENEPRTANATGMRRQEGWHDSRGLVERSTRRFSTDDPQQSRGNDGNGQSMVYCGNLG